MTKLLNIGLMRQDFYHVIIYVLQFCSSAVLQLYSRDHNTLGGPRNKC
jgi:hypothetical protein